MNFMEIWGRVQQETEIKSLTNLAKLIGITQPSVSERKRKNEFPLDWAYIIAKKYSLSMDWLISGEEPIRRNAIKEPKNKYIVLLDEWLNEIANADPRKEYWFQCSIEKTFPEFKEWVQQKNAADQYRRLAERVA